MSEEREREALVFLESRGRALVPSLTHTLSCRLLLSEVSVCESRVARIELRHRSAACVSRAHRQVSSSRAAGHFALRLKSRFRFLVGGLTGEEVCFG